MLTKEECEKALSEIEYSLCELEETKTGVDVYCLIDENIEIVKQLIKEHFNPNPNNYTEIKEGMWVWDRNVKEIAYICNVSANYKILSLCYINRKSNIATINEEGRFFPITKANQ